MHFWNSLPLFRLVIPFILGIIFSDSLYTQRIYLFIPLLLTLLIITHSFVKSYGLRWLFGIIFSCLLFDFAFISEPVLLILKFICHIGWHTAITPNDIFLFVFADV
jgi:hypothetical protein